MRSHWCERAVLIAPAFMLEGLYRDVEGTVTDVGDEVEDEFTLDLAGVASNAGIVFRW